MGSSPLGSKPSSSASRDLVTRVVQQGSLNKGCASGMDNGTWLCFHPYCDLVKLIMSHNCKNAIN